MVPQRLDFGIFLAPFHKAGDNPTLALRRDIELIQHLDKLGYDEVWAGEHHSGGWEISASPELFLAAVGERTQRIRLGTGVVSLPYHHPFHVADRIVALDHLTRGRAMLGVGPGALPGDAYMLGIEPTTQRPRMDEALGIILQLLTSEEPVSYECEWFTLREARLQLKPYQRPPCPSPSPAPSAPPACRPPASTAPASSQWPRTRSRGSPLPTQWSFAEEAAAKAGKPAPDRKDWRIVMFFHLPETREQAIADIEDGIMAWNNEYFVGTIGAPNVQPVSSGREAAERLIDFGGIIGTPDQAVESIRKLQEVSGGFGCLLGLAHEWADREKTLRSYELMARYVMPQVQDTVSWIERSVKWTSDTKGVLMGGATQAVIKAIADGNATQHLAATVATPGIHRDAPAPEEVGKAE